MAKKKETIELSKIAKNVVEMSVKEFVHKNYLPYAYYTITERALIADDGLKPVNRRLLYFMYRQNAKNGKKIKAATIAAGTVGHLHPHGPSSVEGALARMGQNFSLRIPLIDVQGSVGFVTGDPPAASRYWEASLSEAGLELVKEVDSNTVPMRPNFANTMQEPVIVPITWPVGIINGTQGIAVGFASSIVPHNPNEIMDACVARLKDEINTTKDLMKIIKGPDMPTGGELIGIDGVKEYLETGSGTFSIRGKYTIEKLNKGKHQIIFNELPYQISAEQVITSIKKNQGNGKLKDISEAKDLSGMKTGLKLVIYTKAGTNPKMVIEDLWKYTPCQSKFSSNMTVLINGKPQQVGMIELLDQFLSFREECIERKLQFNVDKLEKELNKISAILSVLIDIDAAISIIRKSENIEVASQKLQKKFKITEQQADYILHIQLKTLTKSNKIELKNRKKTLEDEIKRIKKILKNKKLFIEEIIKELEDIKNIIKDNRRTTITNITTENLKEKTKANRKLEKALSKNVDCVITTFADNTIMKTLDKIEFNDIPIKDEIVVKSKSQVYSVNSLGEIKEINVENIPVNTHTKLSLLGIDDKSFVGLTKEGICGTLIVTNFGNVNITKDKLKEGNLITLIMAEKIIYAKYITQEQFDSFNLAILSKDGLLGYIKLNSIRQARQGSGTITGMKNNLVVGATISKDDKLTAISEQTIKTIDSTLINATGRNTKGVIFQRLDEKDNMISLHSNIEKMVIDNKITDPIDISNRGTKGNKKPNKLTFVGY